MSRQNYLVIDIGTGNVRVGVIGASGNIVKVATDHVCYHRDDLYPNAIYFDPGHLWKQIMQLCGEALSACDPGSVAAVTTSSQREGIVLTGRNGEDIIGMPNIDHRGREYEGILQDKNRIYNLTGRYPTSLFSAFKVLGLSRKHPDAAAQTGCMLSISDWALFRLSGIKGYEHSQASETLLYDVAGKCWSEELCAYFGIDPGILPPLTDSGEVAGTLLPSVAEALGLSENTPVVTGGADTQLAVRSTIPSTNDIVLVSGTTTPVVKITDRYVTDNAQRTWTNRHTVPGLFILETNAGVTGLNLQRYKSVFYPNEPYEVMEAEISEAAQAGPVCMAALGSLIAGEEQPLIRGGFIFPVPFSHDLTRGQFSLALLWDLSCSVYENYLALCEVTPHTEPYLWACGGGMQSRLLRQFLADLTGKEVRVRENYRQATVAGGAVTCNHALGITDEKEDGFSSTFPDPSAKANEWYRQWKDNRIQLKKTAL